MSRYKFDLNQYLGTWYSIVSYPQFFQNDLSKITAEYTVQMKDTVIQYIIVKNSGVNEKGQVTSITGKAFTTNDPMTLKIQFFWPIKAEYKIEYVDPSYQYAIVGNSKQSTLWILARTSQIDSTILDHLVDICVALGYDNRKLAWTN